MVQGIEQRWVQPCAQVLSHWQPWAELATGEGFSSDQIGVMQKAWDLVLHKYILGIVQQN